MDNQKCLVKDCTGDIKCRGLCHSCYNTASKLIKKGLANEKVLVERGLMLARKPRGGRPENNKFLQAFRSLLSN